MFNFQKYSNYLLFWIYAAQQSGIFECYGAGRLRVHRLFGVARRL